LGRHAKRIDRRSIERLAPVRPLNSGSDPREKQQAIKNLDAADVFRPGQRPREAAVDV